MSMINLLIISLLVVTITDLTDFWDSVSKSVWMLIWGRSRPYPKDFNWEYVLPIFRIFRCSFCQVWWIGVIYVLCTGITIPMLGYCMLLAFMTPIMKDALILVRDLMSMIINKINNKLYD